LHQESADHAITELSKVVQDQADAVLRLQSSLRVMDNDRGVFLQKEAALRDQIDSLQNRAIQLEHAHSSISAALTSVQAEKAELLKALSATEFVVKTLLSGPEPSLTSAPSPTSGERSVTENAVTPMST
jgi:chromosome segregation ATPase